MKIQFRNVYGLLKRSVKKYGKDDPLKLAGTTAYFTVFTMAPIIIIIVSITGFFIGQENIQEKVFVEINQLIGEKGTQYVHTLVDNYTGTEKGILGTTIGFLAFFFTFGIITLIFAMIYKFLTDAKIKWKVTWVGAVITAFLFMIGKLLIGLALGKTNIGLMYGAAGSMVIILLWVFYSSIIFFFGAEITQQYAEMFSESIVPKENAVNIEIKEITSD